MSERPEPQGEAEVWVVEPGLSRSRSDRLATEEPLEIRLRAADGDALTRSGLPVHRSVAVTMRTPGADFELAAGFLYGEGVIHAREEIRGIAHCDRTDLGDDQRFNIVNVDLKKAILPDVEALQRHFTTTSACGVCGKKSLESLRIRGASAITGGPIVPASVVRGLPETLRAGQSLFAATGGLHAAGLFDAEGRLLALREDVGRHNAVDKLVGWAFLHGRLPLSDQILMVSGRTSFEILQKAVMAGIPMVCAVSAPSTLAVALAREYGVTLIGFLRGERFNVYAGLGRLAQASH